MKRNILFKTLVDILFVAQVIGFIGILFFIPSGVMKINMMDLPLAEWTWISWIILFLSLMGYIVFVIGLFHLRKVARQLLSKRYFDITVVNHLRKSGSCFILAGILSFVVFIILWSVKISVQKVSIYDTDFMISLFVMTIGLFFIIQSEVIKNAKNFKDDSDLTI